MIGEFLPEALDFYRWIEENFGVALWHPMPILRLAGNDDEWAKMRAKAARADVEVWVDRELAKQEIDGWLGGFEIRSDEDELDVELDYVDDDDDDDEMDENW